MEPLQGKPAGPSIVGDLPGCALLPARLPAVSPASRPSTSRNAPTLTDGVVLLRLPEAHDIPTMTLGGQDPEVARWTNLPSPYTEQDARAWIMKVTNLVHWWDEPTWVIADTDDRWCGSVHLERETEGSARVRFLVAPELRGRGIATRAVRLACRWGFSSLRLNVITWRALIGNEAARAVAQASGFSIHNQIMRRGLSHRGQLMDCWFADLVPEDLIEATSGPVWSGPQLTKREREVLHAMAAGLSNRDIAETLNISENTVKNHVRSILEKLPAKSRMEAVVKGVQEGITRLS